MWHSSSDKPDDNRYVLVELIPEIIIKGYSRYMVCQTERGTFINKEGGFSIPAPQVEKWAYVVELS